MLLVTLDFPPLLGGIANYYFNLVKKIAPNEVAVLMNKTANQPEANYPFEIYYKKFFSKFIWPHWLPLVWQVYHTARKIQAQQLWVGQVLPVGTAVLWVARWLKLPYKVTCHGNDLLRAKQSARKYALAQKILKAACQLEANTQFTKNILVNDFKIAAEKIKIVYPQNVLKKEMVNQNQLAALRNKYQLANKKVILTVARLVKSKGVEQVIKSLKSVLVEVPQAVYLIVGAGPEKNTLAALATGLPVILVGAVPQSALPNFYALADVFVLTPRALTGDTESFGVVYLEALEFGLPVIAGRAGGVEEIAQQNKNVYLVDAEDIQEISREIIKWIKD